MSEASPKPGSDPDLDDHIAQVEYMANVWKRQAALNGSSDYGALISDIARGYVRELDALHAARARSAPQVRDSSCTIS